MLSNSDSIALASAVISASALGLTIWQGLIQRQHARLSVRPYFVVLRDLRRESLSLVLINTGLGPGSFKHFRLKIDATTYDINNIQDKKKLRDKLNSKLGGQHVSIHGPGSGHFLNVGWRQPIVEFPNFEKNAELESMAIWFVENLKIEAKYECLYGISYEY